jgi:hypothetical protein
MQAVRPQFEQPNWNCRPEAGVEWINLSDRELPFNAPVQRLTDRRLGGRSGLACH